MDPKQLLSNLLLLEGYKIDYRCKYLLARLIVIGDLALNRPVTLKQCLQYSPSKEKQTRLIMDQLVAAEVMKKDLIGRECFYSLKPVKSNLRKAEMPLAINKKSSIDLAIEIMKADYNKQISKPKSSETQPKDKRSLVLTTIIFVLLANKYHKVSGIGKARLKRLIGVSKIKLRDDIETLKSFRFINYLLPGIKSSVIVGPQFSVYELDMLRISTVIDVKWLKHVRIIWSERLPAKSPIGLLCFESIDNANQTVSEKTNNKPTKEEAQILHERYKNSAEPVSPLFLSAIPAFIDIFKDKKPHGSNAISHLVLLLEDIFNQCVLDARIDEIESPSDALTERIAKQVGIKVISPLRDKVTVNSLEIKILTAYFTNMLLRLVGTFFNVSKDDLFKKPARNERVSNRITDLWICHPTQTTLAEKEIYFYVQR